MIEAILSIIPRINREGYIFIAIFFIGSLILGLFYHPLFWIGLILTIWCVYFFRDPIRITPIAEHLVISPADGEISWVGEEVPPQELGLGDEKMHRISVFMDVFSVHVNRVPIDGVIKSITYKPGKFENAKLDKSNQNNERNSLILETKYGSVAVVQIAGMIARKILCWSHVNEKVLCGERFGMIRFGSRVDIYLPINAKILTSFGQTAIAGETVLASFNEKLDWDDFRCE